MLPSKWKCQDCSGNLKSCWKVDQYPKHDQAEQKRPHNLNSLGFVHFTPGRQPWQSYDPYYRNTLYVVSGFIVENYWCYIWQQTHLNILLDLFEDKRGVRSAGGHGLYSNLNFTECFNRIWSPDIHQNLFRTSNGGRIKCLCVESLGYSTCFLDAWCLSRLFL